MQRLTRSCASRPFPPIFADGPQRGKRGFRHYGHVRKERVILGTPSRAAYVRRQLSMRSFFSDLAHYVALFEPAEHFEERWSLAGARGRAW